MSLPLRWEDPSPPEPVITPSRTPQRRRSSRTKHILISSLFITVSLLIGSLAVLGGQRVWENFHTPSTLYLASRPNGQEVTAGQAAIERRLGFVTVTGSIASHVTRPLSQVESVVELLDAQNETVQVESGMIAFDPLLPGQMAPFRVELPDNVRAVGYRIRFKELSGASLD